MALQRPKGVGPCRDGDSHVTLPVPAAGRCNEAFGVQ